MRHNFSNAPDAPEAVYLDEMNELEIRAAIKDIAGYADDCGWTADSRYIMDRLMAALETVSPIAA